MDRKQGDIAIEVGLSQSYFSQILNGKRRAGWDTAKRLAKITKTRPSIWIDGTPKQRRKALDKLKRAEVSVAVGNSPEEAANVDIEKSKYAENHHEIGKGVRRN